MEDEDNRLTLEVTLTRQGAGVSTASGWKSRRCNLDDVEEELGENLLLRQVALTVALSRLNNNEKIAPFFQWRPMPSPSPGTPRTAGA